jgi:Uma2 family endonuclease
MAVTIESSKINAEPRPWRWTVAQYHQLAEAGWFDNKRVELINGEIIEMPPIGSEHRAVAMGAPRILAALFGDAFSISVQSSLVLDDGSEPEPDVVVARGHWREFADDLPLERVVLIVEIAKSTLHNDLTTKANLYASADLPEYWVIDLVNSELVVHRAPHEGGYTQIQRLKKGESAQPLHAAQGAVVVSDLML